MIEIKNISKVYQNNVGNFDISLNIKQGEVYSIVGPNGAGKTTLIRQILGFIKSDDGFISIDGMDSWKDRRDIMKFTGYVPGELTLYNDFSGISYIKLVSKYRENIDWDFINKLIKHFDIDTKIKIKKMSKGMKQKIAIISAIINKPKFLVLDEPTSGLDPIMQEEFNVLIQIIKKDFKTTIIICSHIFEEVINLSDRVGFIKDGKLIDEFNVKNKDINELRNKFKSIYKKEKIF